MNREFKPGAVAMVRWDKYDPCIAMFSRGQWRDIDGTEFDGREDDIDIRPLVVIDPEDREQASALVEAMAQAQVWSTIPSSVEALHTYRTEQMQAALREFANPTPPKLDEPAGRYAVVEDDQAVEWVHAEPGNLPFGWQSIEGAKSRWADWSDIAAVKVLSEGVVSA